MSFFAEFRSIFFALPNVGDARLESVSLGIKEAQVTGCVLFSAG